MMTVSWYYVVCIWGIWSDQNTIRRAPPQPDIFPDHPVSLFPLYFPCKMEKYSLHSEYGKMKKKKQTYIFV